MADRPRTGRVAAVFPALAVRNYRWFVACNLVGNSATWMQRVALDWAVLEASGSAVLVGIATMLQFGPLLVFGLLGGAVVDRFSRRSLLVLTQGIASALSVVLGILHLSGAATLPVLLVASAARGLLTVVDNPARHAIVGDLVGRDLMPAAISLNASVFQLGRLIGPVLSGAAIASIGAGWSFVANGVACALMVIGLLRSRPDEMFEEPRSASDDGIGQGLATVRAIPLVGWTIMLVGIVSVSALNLPVLLTSLARESPGTGALDYGLFTTLCAVGALIGAVLLAHRPFVSFTRVVGAAAVLGVVQTLLALPDQLVTAACLVGVGFFGQTFLTSSNAFVQRSVPSATRGRVMALYLMLLLGGQALGGPLAGLVVEHLGLRQAIAASGLAALTAALATAMVVRSGRGPVVSEDTGPRSAVER
ncbi:MFS transporter [Curtobacterium luteum]|uniref:MFS transporter n=3 Tax=Curtobacterium luteum TaxID=33881 RepID=A0A8H9G7M3_9MICO|nr:MFS transporter [Curtobacterium luteum]NUU52466.1 MFS transporter [Curtobacterium luteum]GGK96837.1 MFS transporter [Curtobacterium luteum]